MYFKHTMCIQIVQIKLKESNQMKIGWLDVIFDKLSEPSVEYIGDINLIVILPQMMRVLYKSEKLGKEKLKLIEVI